MLAKHEKLAILPFYAEVVKFGLILTHWNRPKFLDIPLSPDLNHNQQNR